MAIITFIGGEECGNIGFTTVGSGVNAVEFPINEPVEVNPESAQDQSRRNALAHLVKKAKTNRFFIVEDDEGDEPGDDAVGEPAKRRGRPPKVREE